MLAEGYRQSQAVLRTQKTSQLPILKKSDLFTSAGGVSDTFFILGSGESVLHLTPKHWLMVRQGVSVGIGAWTIHPFIPDYLALEHIEREPEQDGLVNRETGSERSYREALDGWHADEEVQMRQPRILFFRPPKFSDLSRLAPLGDYWRGRTYLYGRMGPSSRHITELDGEIALYLRLAKSGIVPFSLPFDTGATVVRLIFLAALAGYQKIVLAGVDLRDSRFFWETEPEMLIRRGMSSFFTSERGAAHSTETTGSFPASEVLPVIGKVICDLLGTKLMVAHESSWVSTILPVLDWKSLTREERR
jgi:hypothetical protein